MTDGIVASLGVGLESFSCLGRAFLRTVLALPPAVDSSVGVAPGLLSTCRRCCPSGICPGFHLTLLPRDLDGDGKDYDEDDDCRGSDLVVYVLLFLLCRIFSWSSGRLMWGPVAKRYVASNAGLKLPDEAAAAGDAAALETTQHRREKFVQCLTAASVHVISAFFGWRVMTRKDWLWPSERWSSVTTGVAAAAVDADLKFYYLLYAARYTSDLASLLFWEHRRSDFWAYAIHHLTTILAVFGSAIYGYTRIGGVIMFFLDWADPPLLLGKACIYLSLDPTDIFQFCADRLFEVFTVVFLLTRNVMFTFVVWRAIQDYPDNIPACVLKGFLIILMILMIFWLGLIIQVAVHKLQHNGVEDVRSDHPEDDDGQDVLGLASSQERQPIVATIVKKHL